MRRQIDWQSRSCKPVYQSDNFDRQLARLARNTVPVKLFVKTEHCYRIQFSKTISDVLIWKSLNRHRTHSARHKPRMTSSRRSFQQCWKSNWDSTVNRHLCTDENEVFYRSNFDFHFVSRTALETGLMTICIELHCKWYVKKVNCNAGIAFDGKCYDIALNSGL